MGFAIWQTPLGPCGIRWSESGVQQLVFGRTSEAVRARLWVPGASKRGPHPPFIHRTRLALRQHLSGRPWDFTAIPLDLSQTSAGFRRLASALRQTGPGATVDAEALGRLAEVGGGSAGVRRLLARNPVPLLVPSHRVLAADGLLGAWGGGEEQHERLLGLEGLAHPSLYQRHGRPARPRMAVALAHLQARDPTLGELIHRVGPYRVQLRLGESPYEALARSIVGQQITGRAAKAILLRLASEFGTAGVPPPERILRATAKKLRTAGLSGNKARALRDLASHTLTGAVPPWRVLRRWPDERILTTLTQIHGVGRWTVEMLLIFRLGRPDVLPLGDYGIQKGYARAFGRRPSRRELQRRGWRWRPFRSVASWYLWRALELP